MSEEVDEINSAVETKQWMSFDSEKWRSFLSLNIPNFKGDYANAAKLLDNFCAGIKVVSEKYLDHQYPTNLESLPIALVYNPEETQAFYYKNQGVEKICFEISGLETMSQMDQQKIYELNDLGDDVETWTGTIPELVRQMGVEESHHAVYQNKKRIKSIQDKGLTQPEYDSQQHEFRALMWQIRDLNSRGENISADVLERRITKARLLLAKNNSEES